MRPHRHLRRRRQRRRLLSKRLAQTGYRGHRCARPHEPVVELDCTRAPPDARAFFDAFVRRLPGAVELDHRLVGPGAAVAPVARLRQPLGEQPAALAPAAQVAVRAHRWMLVVRRL